MRLTIEQASKLLASGHVVAVPTETVYGLAASLEQKAAVDAIFTLKGRPSENPLIVHLRSVGQLDAYVKTLPESLEALAGAFWPGPLTIVLPADEHRVPSRARAGLPTAAFRIPNHPVALSLIEQAGPLVMPSANLSGRPSATSADHVESDFGERFPVLEGGRCSYGVESTILGFAEGMWQILRLGAITGTDLERVLGYCPRFTCSIGQEKPACPGQLYRHYSPKAILYPAAVFDQGMKGAAVGFSDRDYPSSLRMYSLGSSLDPAEAAENLYAVLRQLDADSVPSAYLDMDIPEYGLWATVRERLQRAATSPPSHPGAPIASSPDT